MCDCIIQVLNGNCQFPPFSYAHDVVIMSSPVSFFQKEEQENVIIIWRRQDDCDTLWRKNNIDQFFEKLLKVFIWRGGGVYFSNGYISSLPPRLPFATAVFLLLGPFIVCVNGARGLWRGWKTALLEIILILFFFLLKLPVTTIVSSGLRRRLSLFSSSYNWTVRALAVVIPTDYTTRISINQ